ncbi:uncharacterized protein LOC133191188 [Saccostrea echinata]|uniref:uncharacterized protein LOC133191188 n=1 Tax=Saccostrea echinata TaxID=191078 RepID=UPI002A7EEDAF|nr:uncharacterized protein LOC133191188 [Saccostrea echinata]
MAQTSHGANPSSISEAFSFLKEYQLGTAFDEAKSEKICYGGHNGLVNGENEEFTIVTYVDNKGPPEKSFSKTKNYSENWNNEPRSMLENSANKLNDHAMRAGLKHECNVSSARSPIKDSTEGERMKLHDEMTNERSSAQQRSDCSCHDINHCVCNESNSKNEQVVMRKHRNVDVNNFVHKSLETKCSDSKGILSAACNSSSVDREEVNQSRRTGEVVSDAFDFLKDMEDGQHPHHHDSVVIVTGEEDKIFNKLSIVSETSEKSNSLNVNSISGNDNSISDNIKDSQYNPESPTKEQSKVLRRQQNVSSNSQDNSEDSSDEDTGIYNESYRKSVWLCMPEEKSPRLFQPSSIAEEQESDEVFLRSNDTLQFDKPHKRSDSTTTTKSECEFKHEYRIRRKCMVHRHDSQQEYHRLSAKLYEQEKVVVITKEDHDRDFGLHIYDSHPAFITDVDMGSPAHRAGIKPGQILIGINGVNVLESSHEEIIKLVQKDPSIVKLEVAAGNDVHYIRNSQTPVLSGYMYKQSNSTFVKNWRRRYFVLRYDNCLYYYKGEQDPDPLGAFPLLNYIVSKHTDSSKGHCFKAEKFGARTYYFIPDSREEMIKWISALNEAATRAREKKDAWMDVTAHNVGLPALDIKKPDCSGYLSKCGGTVKTWRKRYCVLKDACIYYYKNINSSSAQGMAHLHGYSVDQVPGAPRKHNFILRPPESQMRTFSFCAENETDKNRWMVAMEKSIERWIKVD